MAETYSYTTTVKQQGKGWSCYLPLPEAHIDALKEGGNKRVIVHLRKEYKVHAAILFRKAFGHFIMLSKKHMKALELELGSEVKATVKIDDTKYQFEVPETFAEVVRTDPEAEAILEKLTPGGQRSILAAVAAVNNTDKQIDRALKIADLLKQGVTNIRTIKF